MLTRLSGITGSLFPGRYLEDGLSRDLPGLLSAARLEPTRRRFLQWWAVVERTCGPATGLRALFDLVAMPAAGMLGFRASHARFEAKWASARLDTRRGTPVALLLLPWSTRHPTVWRELVKAAREIDASWCLLVAPPSFSIVDARGRAVRRSVDFVFPDALAPESFARWWWLAQASSFDVGRQEGSTSARPTRYVSGMDALVASAAAHQDAVGADLQRGVFEALRALAASAAAARGRPGQDSFDEALIIVYRILFLLFAESRDLVPRTHPVYSSAYSMATLCREALESNDVPGLWEGLAAVTRLSRSGCSIDDLVVPGFNGRLFARAAAPTLERRGSASGHRPRQQHDEAARQALVALGTRPGRAGREQIAYADLGVEELGSVYERVLDLDPAAPDDRPRGHRRRGARARHSDRRKESATFYTPRPLAEFVVRRTLEPLVLNRSADQILELRVLDPAMGSGAFLVAACRFLADAYERAIVEEGRLGEADLDGDARADIRRLVAEHCLAGVDDNPTAVELARLSVWLTTLARGKPLGFLDHRLRAGNSLLGSTPDDLARVTGGRHARRTAAALPLFDADDLHDTIEHATRPLFQLLARRDDTVADVRFKERLWQQLSGRQSPLDRWRQACSLWCCQWLWPDGGPRERPSPPVFRAAIDALVGGDRTLPPAVLCDLLETARIVAADRRLFHWPLEFPDVFYQPDGQPLPRPGFDAIVGNPPWEMLRRDPSASAGPGAVSADSRAAVASFVRHSGVYPRCTNGHVNLYQPFLERALSLARPGGRVGLVMPWGLASDDGSADLRAELIRQGLHTVVGLDNGRGLFPIHRGLRFLVLVARKGGPACTTRARFGVQTAAELEDLPGRDEDPAESAYPIRLSPDLLATIGGTRARLPDGRRPADLRLADRLMRAFPALGSDAGWTAAFGRELNATDDKALFCERGLPVIEGKHIAPFVVNAASAAHRIDRHAAVRALGAGRIDRPRLAYRDVSGFANRLSLIAAVVPAGVVTTHTLFCLRPAIGLAQQHFLCALLNSWVLNAVVRMFMGQHITTGLVEDLPAPIWTGDAEDRQLARLAVRLSRGGSPAPVEAELQARVARRYGVGAEEFAGLVEGFPLIDPARRALAVQALREASP